MDKLQGILIEISQTLKHMRGRHDQRDHAWNRGMGRGGGGTDAAVSHPNKATVNVAQYRENLVTLQQLVNAGKMTYHDMRNEQRKLRGYEPLPPRTRKQLIKDGKGLAQAEANFVELAETQTPTLTNTLAENANSVTEAYLQQNDPNSLYDRTLVNPVLIPAIANAGKQLRAASENNEKFKDAKEVMKMFQLDAENDDDWQLLADLLSIYTTPNGEGTDYSSLRIVNDGRIFSRWMGPGEVVAGKRIKAVRTISLNKQTSEMEIHNAIFASFGNSNPSGIGHSMVMRQVAAAKEIGRRMGYSIVCTTDASSDSSTNMNGYHTWPKLGYKFPIPDTVKEKLREQYGFKLYELLDTTQLFISRRLIDGKTVTEAWSDIVNNWLGGRVTISGTWTVTDPDDPGLRVLKEYNKIVRTRKSKAESYSDEFGFSDEDMEIFNAAWSRIRDTYTEFPQKNVKMKSVILRVEKIYARSYQD